MKSIAVAGAIFLGAACTAATAQTFKSSAGGITVETIVSGLANPWALAFLPAFQVALFLALWAAAFAARDWARFLGGLGILALTQVTGLLALLVSAGPLHVGVQFEQGTTAVSPFVGDDWLAKTASR